MAISAEDRKTLIALARLTVGNVASGQRPPSPPPPADLLGERRGCFVTLTTDGHLRGCIGTFRPDRPLGEMVVEMAAAACHDPRFGHMPIRPYEVDLLTVEVSVLSELEPIDDPLSLEIGTHGIYIVRGHAAGCFLPEVATDQGWNAQEFLDFCCEGKAGLPVRAWQEPGTTVYVFTSEKFRG